MNRTDETNNRECQQVQAHLTDYLDNTLSGRRVWEVEKHLAACRSCAQVTQQMRATVRLLQDAPRFDTGDDFMAKLHARLDTLEPDALRPPSRLAVLRDRLTSLKETLSLRRVPVLGLGVSMAALCAVVLWPRMSTPISLPETPRHIVSQKPDTAPELGRNVALLTRDPLEDPAAAVLDAHSAAATQESHAVLDEVDSVLDADQSSD